MFGEYFCYWCVLLERCVEVVGESLVCLDEVLYDEWVIEVECCFDVFVVLFGGDVVLGEY